MTKLRIKSDTVTHTAHFQLQEPTRLATIQHGTCGHKHRNFLRAKECENSYKRSDRQAGDNLILTTWICTTRQR